MVEAPKLYCPLEGRKVPVWWCVGSFVQGKAACDELIEATVDISKDFADVKCRPRNFCKGGVNNK